MRRVNDQQILVRRRIQKQVGLIQLPDEYMMGTLSGAKDAGYRFAECIDAKDIPVGAKVVVHEAMSQSLELIGDKVHRVPIDFVLGYLEEGRPFQCYKNIVLVKPDPVKETVGNSFILAPESSKLPATTGTVVSLGPDCKYLEVGARVMFALFSGLEIELEGESFILLRELPLTPQWTDEILGVVDEAPVSV